MVIDQTGVKTMKKKLLTLMFMTFSFGILSQSVIDDREIYLLLRDIDNFPNKINICARLVFQMNEIIDYLPENSTEIGIFKKQLVTLKKHINKLTDTGQGFKDKHLKKLVVATLSIAVIAGAIYADKNFNNSKVALKIIKSARSVIRSVESIVTRKPLLSIDFNGRLL